MFYFGNNLHVFQNIRLNQYNCQTLFLKLINSDSDVYSHNSVYCSYTRCAIDVIMANGISQVMVSLSCGNSNKSHQMGSWISKWILNKATVIIRLHSSHYLWPKLITVINFDYILNLNISAKLRRQRLTRKADPVKPSTTKRLDFNHLLTAQNGTSKNNWKKS